MSRIISFPQAFALNKGANYAFNASFLGLPIRTLTNPSGYQFTQPAFKTPAANLYDTSSPTYTLANTSNSGSAGLVYYKGGNLVNVAIKWTNGKSLGNWYQIQRHSNTFTDGSVSSDGKVLRITCGNTTSLLNRSLIHDTKFQRSGAEITETSATVVGYLQPTDTVDTSVYFKGYVEPFNFNGVSSVDPNRRVGSHTIFFVGYRYLHTQSGDGLLSSVPLDTYTSSAKGWGFQAIRKDNTNFNWYCIVIADIEALTQEAAICYAVDTGVSAFATNSLLVTYESGTITWKVNNVQVATLNTANLASQGHVLQNGTGNALYACVASMKGGPSSTIPGQFTIAVQEAAVFRSLTHINSGNTGGTPANRFEDTDTEVTSTDTDYHTTGLQLLKKLK